MTDLEPVIIRVWKLCFFVKNIDMNHSLKAVYSCCDVCKSSVLHWSGSQAVSVFPQHFHPEAPPSEGPQYMNKAFSAYRGIYIEKEDLQMELNKVVLQLLILLLVVDRVQIIHLFLPFLPEKTEAGFREASDGAAAGQRAGASAAQIRDGDESRWRLAFNQALSQCNTITSVSVQNPG